MADTDITNVRQALAPFALSTDRLFEVKGYNFKTGQLETRNALVVAILRIAGALGLYDVEKSAGESLSNLYTNFVASFPFDKDDVATAVGNAAQDVLTVVREEATRAWTNYEYLRRSGICDLTVPFFIKEVLEATAPKAPTPLQEAVGTKDFEKEYRAAAKKHVSVPFGGQKAISVPQCFAFTTEYTPRIVRPHMSGERDIRMTMDLQYIRTLISPDEVDSGHFTNMALTYASLPPPTIGGKSGMTVTIEPIRNDEDRLRGIRFVYGGKEEVAVNYHGEITKHSLI